MQVMGRDMKTDGVGYEDRVAHGHARTHAGPQPPGQPTASPHAARPPPSRAPVAPSHLLHAPVAVRHFLEQHVARVLVTSERLGLGHVVAHEKDHGQDDGERDAVAGRAGQCGGGAVEVERHEQQQREVDGLAEHERRLLC